MLYMGRKRTGDRGNDESVFSECACLLFTLQTKLSTRS